MRPLAAALVVAAFGLAPIPAAAQDAPTRLELKVGEEATVGGANGRCDDPGIATITLGAQAIITGVKPGTTICSARVGGLLRVYEVKVVAAHAPAPDAERR